MSAILRHLFLSLGLLAMCGLSVHGQNSSNTGALGTLSIGPYTSTSTSTLSGPPVPATTLAVREQYENTTSNTTAQDSLNFTVQMLGGSGAFLSTYFSKSYSVGPHVTATFPIGSIPNPGVGTYVVQVTAFLYNRQFREWSTSAQRTYQLYITQPLAVELTSFTARALPAGVRLLWYTASEKDNHHFDVERSANGKDYLKLTTVTGHGTTSQAHAYEWLDQGPTGKLYYRLRQVDTDGTMAFSPVVTANAAGSLRIFPNPAKDQVTVSGAPADAELVLLSATGQEVLRRLIPEGGVVSLQAVPVGNYLARVGAYTQRLTIR